MNTRRARFVTAPLALVGLLGVAVAAPGCSEDNPLCCNENDFQVGGSIQLEGSAQAEVGLQAVADFAGVGAAIIADLTAACRTMAEDLDADPQARADAEANPDNRAKMEAYCNLAVSAIADFKAQAQGSITVSFEPPVCEASISAKASCQASCSASAECDIQANPPTCEGGKLEVACKGSCTAMAGASVSCEGSCTGSCEGSCTVEGGSVECAGRCNGTCMGSTDSQGNCMGECEGTCEVTAPGAECEGTCNGQCDASCQGSAEASVKCDGQCDAEFEPLKCEGGELKGGCEVEASCDANCDASVQAKAECKPPSISVDISAAGNLEAAGKLKLVLEANLGLVAALSARLEGMASIAGTVTANLPDVIAEVKVACIPVVIAAMGEASLDVTAGVSASVSILGEVGA